MIQPMTESEKEFYISLLLEDAEVYTTFPKPRGKDSAPKINRMSDDLRHCFKPLSELGRLDVICEIMEKLARVKDILTPVTYDTWIHIMTNELENRDLIYILKEHPMIFEAWAELKSLRTSDILHVADAMGNGSSHDDYLIFRNLVIRHKGYIPGLDTSFQFTSENTETQTMYDGPFTKFELAYIETYRHLDEIGEFVIHLIMTSKTESVDRITISCLLDDIDPDKEQTDFSSRYVSMEEPQEVPLSLYLDLSVGNEFFSDHDISEVQKIKLKFDVLDSDRDVIEATPEIEIIVDRETGLYKVTGSSCSSVTGEE